MHEDIITIKQRMSLDNGNINKKQNKAKMQTRTDNKANAKVAEKPMSWPGNAYVHSA